MRPKLIICGAIVVILAVAPARGVADLVDVTNSIRSQGCGELSAVDRPLRPRMQLDEAARRIAHGVRLETATSGSGYRAKKSASIHIQTAKGDNGVVQMLARRFCGIMADVAARCHVLRVGECRTFKGGSLLQWRGGRELLATAPACMSARLVGQVEHAVADCGSIVRGRRSKRRRQHHPRLFTTPKDTDLV